jgi:hypothetical protein
MRRTLKIHPDSDTAAVSGLTVDATRVGAELRLSYELSGDLAAIALPPPAQAQRADELWRHTCFEAFVRADLAQDYYELNFAPSTQWAAYHFSSYRKEMRGAENIPAPRIDIFSADDVLTMSARIVLPAALARAHLHVGVSAVIEQNGRLSYWALAHPPGKADFHHADGFVLTLPAEAA